MFIGSVANGTMNITQDFRDYSGKDRYKAIGIDLAGLGFGIVAGTVSLGGGVTTLGFSIIANQAIDNYILKYKLENLKTEKEKNSIKRLEEFKKRGESL